MLVVWKSSETFVELVDGHGHRPGDMACRVFLGGPYIEHDDLACSHAAHQLIRGHGFEAVAIPEEVTYYSIHLGQVLLGGAPERQDEAGDLWAGQSVADKGPIAFGGHELRLAQYLEVAGGVCDREGGLGGERFDGPLTLGQQVENL
ncbi:hypothetical protein BI330_21925 [Mycobacterium sp. CBMA 623]|nr:hypothetical protein [Mycobacteroides sp. CBMA 326]